MAKIKRTEVRKRGFFGKLFKWSFVLFNILMATAVFMGLGNIGESIDQATTESERAGAAIGGTVGFGILLFFWVAGAIILGLLTMFTRGNVTYIEETVE